MRRLAFIAPAAFIISFAVAAAAGGGFRGKGHGKATFSATGPAGLKIDGKAGKPEVSQDGGKLVIKVPLKNHIKTGIDLRDEHCGKAINVNTWTAASFIVPVDKLKIPDKGKTIKGDVTGDFKFNGVTKPLKVTYKAEGKGNEVKVEGDATFKYTDFNIKEQCYLGVCVKPPVDVHLEFSVER
jgi:polyisoprenoid-binding protein YceI